jgi:hypothetical protein
MVHVSQDLARLRGTMAILIEPDPNSVTTTTIIITVQNSPM